MSRHTSWNFLAWLVLVPGVAIPLAWPDLVARAESDQPPKNGERVAKDKAILELALPAGAKVILDGEDRGGQRRFVFDGLQARQHSQHEVEIRFEGGRDPVKRTVFVRGGWHVQLPVAAPGISRPELVMQVGHRSAVHAVVFSRDGRYVLTASADRTVMLWERATGRKIRDFSHADVLTAAALSPDGRQVLSACMDNTPVLWDVASGRQLRAFRGHTALPTSVAFSPDGREALTGSYDRTAILWEVATGHKVRAFEGHTAEVTSVAFSPDGRQVLTGSADGTAILWERLTGQQVHLLRGHAGGVRSVALSPDGKKLLTGSDDKTAILWDTATGEQVRAFRGHTEAVTSVAFRGDGQQVVTGSLDQTAVLWSTTTGRRLQVFRHEAKVLSVACSPDGGEVLVGSHEAGARLWDAASGKEVRAFIGSTDNDKFYTVMFGPDGQQLLTGFRRDNRAILRDAGTGRVLQVLEGHTQGIEAGAFSRDGQQVLTGSFDKTAILWDARTGRKNHTLEGHNDRVAAVAFSPDNSQVLTGSADGTAILWEARTGRQRRTFQGHTGTITAVAFSPDAKRVLTGSGDKTAVVWDAASGEQLRAFKDHGGAVQSVAFSPDGKQVFTGSADGTANLWDSASGEQLGWSRGPWWVNSVAFSPDGSQLLTGFMGGGILLWDAVTRQKLRTFQGHSVWLSAVAFSPNGRQVLASFRDGTAQVWDVATGDELARFLSLDGCQDWAVVTSEGLFDGSRGGREKVYFRAGGQNVVPLDRFFKDFYHPGLLAEIWRGERPMPDKPLQTNPAPLVKVLVNPDPERKGQVHLDVAVTDQGGGIKGPWLQHNGATLGTGRLLSEEGKTRTYRFPVALVPGDNHLEVRAATADGGRESDPVAATIPFDGQLPRPDLYVVAVGINRYAKDAGVADLDFCVPDTRAIAALFRKRAGNLYKEVHVRQLLDEQATKDGILKAVVAVAAQAQPQDTLVLYVAGHGIAIGQRFYVIPHDFQLVKGEAAQEAPQPSSAVALRGYRGSDQQDAAVRARGLAIDELGDELAKVPALKRVLIFDTCHSGSAIQLAGKQYNPFAFRGAIERFSRAQGVYSLSATAADELAAETKDLGHSILTYALLAGMQAVAGGPLDGKPVAAKEGAVDVVGWFGYARQQVPGLYLKYVGRSQQVELSGDDQPTFPLLTLEGK